MDALKKRLLASQKGYQVMSPRNL
jgi:hypothetical protein